MLKALVAIIALAGALALAAPAQANCGADGEQPGGIGSWSAPSWPDDPFHHVAGDAYMGPGDDYNDTPGYWTHWTSHPGGVSGGRGWH